MVILILIIIISIFITILFRKFKNSNKNVYKEIPRATESLPILGNLLKFRNKRTHLVLQEWYEQYGEIYKFKMGSIESIVLTGYPIIKRAFINNSMEFSNRYQRLTRLRNNNGVGVFHSNGNLHNILKSTILSEITNSKIKKIENNIIENEMNKLLNELDKHAINQDPFKIHAYLKHFTLNVILSLIFGISYPHKLKSEMSILIKDVTDFFLAISQIYIPELFPLFESIVYQFCESNVTKSYKKIEKFIIKFTNDYIKKRDDNFQDDNTIIGKLLNDHYKGKIPYESVIGSAVEILIAGVGVPPNLLMSILTQIINNPEIQFKSYQEIKNVISNNKYKENGEINENVLSYSKLKSELVYLSMIIQEGHRMFPPAQIGVPHQVLEDVEFDGYLITKGSQIIQNLWSTHRDSKVYKSPNTFNPDRFLKSNNNNNSQVDENGDIHKLIPYGCGVRFCIGKSLSETELMTCLGTLINRYEFINPNYPTPLIDIRTKNESIIIKFRDENKKKKKNN